MAMKRLVDRRENQQKRTAVSTQIFIRNFDIVSFFMRAMIYVQSSYYKIFINIITTIRVDVI